jgi:hypothetical protein
VFIASLQARVEALAQAFFGLFVPLAVRIDAMNKNDDPRQRQLHQDVEMFGRQENTAGAFAQNVNVGIVQRAARAVVRYW